MDIPDTNATYDSLAVEYYSPSHVTSRNFDQATKDFFSDWHEASDESVILEVGAGRGRIQEFLGVQSNVVQLDSSKGMLEITPREPSLLRIHSDARRTPFLNKTFGLLAAFLFDPFNDDDFFVEAYRVLSSRGRFIGSLPSWTWGNTLRSELGIDLNKTRFYTSGGGTRFAQSILSTSDEIARRLKDIGFTNVKVTEAFLPQSITSISKDILLPAKVLGVSPFQLPLVQIIEAQK